MSRIRIPRFVALFFIIATAGAGSFTDTLAQEPEIEGLILREGGEVIVNIWQGVAYRGIFISPLATTGEITVTWLDPDSTEFQLDPQLFELRLEVADPAVATFDLTGSWSFTITGEAEGWTDLFVRVWHIEEMHFDFESPAIPISVNDPIGIADPPRSGSPIAALFPLYPNPFAGSTDIRYRLQQGADVSLAVFDATGRFIARLARGARSEGEHAIRWDATGLPSGLYFVRLATPAGTHVEKVILAQ
jgi:hypothetical protein